MPSIQPIVLAVLLIASSLTAAHAQTTAQPPDDKEAISIISTHEDINSNLYRVIHIMPGKRLDEEDGFVSENAVRVTAFAPASAGRPKRGIKHYLLQHSEEYGWFIEATKEDTRGVYLEISSQKKGRVIVR